jgi:hypothetical protein
MGRVMSDPVLIKLKADAGIVLADLWRALTGQVPVETQEWQNAAVEPASQEMGSQGSRGEEPKQGSFCWVHLN